MALKCYDKNELRDCGRNEDLLCVSYYAKTVIKYGRNYEIPAGSLGGHCVERSSTHIEEFDGDFSERCIESKLHNQSVCFNICNMSR